MQASPSLARQENVSAAAGNAGGSAASLPAFQVAPASETLFRLANGLSVYLIKDQRFPMVCTRLFVRTGSTHESPEQYGISHVLEHMVFKGTRNRPQGQIAREVESLGGYLNAYTSFDKTCYLTDMPSRHWKTGIDIVRDMAFNPTLDAQELEREKPVIISEMEGRLDEARGRLFEDLQQAVLAGTPYEHPIIGTKETVMAVTPQTLRAYIDRWYQPQNMLLVVAGDMDMAAVRAYVEENFGSLRGTDSFEEETVIAPESVTPTPRVSVRRGSWKKVYLSLAVPVPGITDYSSLQLDLLSDLLAGDGTSLLERRYRQDRHLVDSIDVSNMSLARLGVLDITAVLEADKVEEFFTSIVRDLRDLRMSEFTAEDLARAKFSSLDDFDRSSETLNGLTSWRALIQFELGGRQGEANIRAFLEDVDFELMARTYARYMKPERVRVRALANEQDQLPDLAAILDREWPVPHTSSSEASDMAGARESLTLDNGLELVLIPDRTMPYFALTLMASGGNALLKPETAGLAGLTASLLTAGCGDMDRVAFERRLSARALSISASSSRQAFAITASGPSRYSADLLELTSTMISAPRFEEKEFIREVADMNAARVLRDEGPMGRLTSRLWPALFGNHPYGLDSLGSQKTLAAMKPADVAAFWQKQRAMPWVLAVTGTFDREQIVAWASTFAKASEPAVFPEAPVWGKEKKLTVTMRDKNKAHLLELFPTVTRTHVDAPALMVLDAVLSGQSGLLFLQMRDRDSLGYTVASQNLFLPTAGLSLLYAGTTPDKVNAARAGFAAIMDDLRAKPLPKELLEAGCNTLEGSYIRSRQSLGSRSDEAATEVLMRLPEGFARTLIEKARTVTTEDLQQVVKKYFHDGYEAVLLPE